MTEILLISRDPNFRAELRDALYQLGFATVEKAGDKPVAAVVIDVDAVVETLPDKAKTPSREDWTNACHHFRNLHPNLPQIVAGRERQFRTVIDALRGGFDDYVLVPIRTGDFESAVASAKHSASVRGELSALREQIVEQNDPEQLLVSKCESMRRVLAQIERVAATDSTVLLTGETGTGKSVIARLLHRLSSRQRSPFLAVHCGALPDPLAESELFGHERGAFTGAIRRKAGKFELAADGTIFLDEVGTVSHGVQVKLLQVLQDRVIQRVGGETDIRVRARIVAATNEDLAALCKQGDFREDLFFRLNVFPIQLPRLAERRDDVPALARFFTNRFSQRYGKSLVGIDDEVIVALRAYEWPGNVRELENVIERACILEDGPTLSSTSFPPEMFANTIIVQHPGEAGLAGARARAVSSVERDYLDDLLRRHLGRIDRAAAEAGVSARQLNNLMRKYQLARSSYLAD